MNPSQKDAQFPDDSNDQSQEPTVVEKIELPQEPTVVEKIELPQEPTVVEKIELPQEPTVVEKVEPAPLTNDQQQINAATVVPPPPIQQHQEAEEPAVDNAAEADKDKTLQLHDPAPPQNDPSSEITASGASQGYPQPGQGYPQPGQGYPQPGQGYPQLGQGYPQPGQGYPQPGQGYPQPGQNYAQPAYTKPAKQPGRLAHPLPRWAFLAAIGLVIILLLIVQLTGDDWGDGAVNASRVAIGIGILLLIALAVRSWDGMASKLNPNRLRQYIASALCIIIIFIYSGISQALVPTLHQAQGRSLEAQKQWQAAINEYTVGGEKAPDGVDLAHTYTSWGLALSASQNYDEAMTKFNTVLTQFNSAATKDQVARAQGGDISTRLALAQQYMQARSYDSASSTYDAMLELAYCNATCSTQVDALDATAYYKLGVSQLQAVEYANAVITFDTILKKFSSAPEATQLHGDMAKALLGDGQDKRTANCSDAIPTYQRLVNEYSDTPEGQTAKQDLHAPQTVTGSFSNIADPTITYTQIGLTQGLHGGMAQGDLFNAWSNAQQKTAIQGNGNFSFNNVPQGDYDLMWYGTAGNYEYAEFVYSRALSTPTYTAHVGPLCPTSVGQVTNVFGSGL